MGSNPIGRAQSCIHAHTVAPGVKTHHLGSIRRRKFIMQFVTHMHYYAICFAYACLYAYSSDVQRKEERCGIDLSRQSVF